MVESAELSEEQRARTDLAAAYHLAEYFGWSDVVWGHMTLRLSSGHYLTHKYGLHFNEITPANLLELDANGNVFGNISADAPAFFPMHHGIHSGTGAAVVLHLHPPHSTAVSTLKHGLVPLSTDAMSLQNIIAYDSAARDMAKPFQGGEKRLLFLRNHGVVAIGETVSAAFILIYLAERSSKVQLLAQAASAGGDGLVMPSAHLVQAYAEEFKSDATAGLYEWKALLRLLKRERHQPV
jgi:ribulose-5-phosphate 4-epimerase/fuculose-1-phosphate aldolase